MFRNLSIDFRRAWSLLVELLRLSVGMPLALMGYGDPPQVRFRYALQRLGMTYLKLGQFLALRIDLLPREWCAELSKLFEQAAPMPAAEVRSVIESEAGMPLENVFQSFLWDPLASASIAQVHEAFTLEGQRVAVKVQRKKMEMYFAADMRNIRRIAAIIDMLKVIGELSVVEVTHEFENYTSKEFDFVAEGRAADRFREAAVSGEIVPHILWHLTTRRMLTMEFVEGISLAKVKVMVDTNRVDELKELMPEVNLFEAMRNLVRASMHQLLVVGFFHADLHPGNVLLCRNNSIAFLDYGISGSVSAQKREQLANHLEHVALGNIDESFRAYSGMFQVTDRTDYEAFELECKTILRSWVEAIRNTDTPVEQRLVAGFSEEMFAVVRRHHLIVGLDTILFWRAMIILDATVLQLCHGFDLLKELREFFVLHRPGLLERIRDSARLETAAAAVNLAGSLPKFVEDLLRSMTQGQFKPLVTVDESTLLRQDNSERLGIIALACFGVSLALLQRVADPGFPQIALAVLALVCLLIPLFAVNRRLSPHPPPQKKRPEIKKA